MLRVVDLSGIEQRYDESRKLLLHLFNEHNFVCDDLLQLFDCRLKFLDLVKAVWPGAGLAGFLSVLFEDGVQRCKLSLLFIDSSFKLLTFLLQILTL